MQKTSLKFITKLIDKYIDRISYTEEEKGNFYTCLKGDEVYICCANETGDCWIEEFTRKESVFLYFNSDTPIEDIYNYDHKGYDKAPKRITKLLER